MSAKAIGWESVHQTIRPKASDHDGGGTDFHGLAPIRLARQRRQGKMLQATEFHLPGGRAAASSDAVLRLTWGRLFYRRMTHVKPPYITHCK
ncbi:MAG TPA: hypothetical protein VGM32_16915 [Rhodopila sp.]